MGNINGIMDAPTAIGQPLQRSSARLPPLENGDCLTREDFLRRYEAWPDWKKAELVEGVVYVATPVRFTAHGEQDLAMLTWLGVYQISTPGVRAGGNSTVSLDPDNVPQPDGLMIIDPAWGGQTEIDSHGYVESAPELVEEIAASSVSIDLHQKFEVYRRNHVREYVVWRVLDEEIDWFVLRGDHYERLPLSQDGIYKSEVFPGLWLDPKAMVNSDFVRVHKVLHEGLASREHADFVRELAQKRPKPS
jgi:Uma2 family endonuclease